jgi:glutaryl-CoA dehydrogenase
MTAWLVGPGCSKDPGGPVASVIVGVFVEQLAESIGEALGTDYYALREPFTDQQNDYLTRTRQFVHDDVIPVINDYWERAELPYPLIEKMGKLGLIGDGIEGYGCPPMDPLSAGLIHMELHRGDGSVGTVLAVQAGLAMRSIAMYGSEEQKQHWLPAMARAEKLGAFALTEPEHGSDSVALETTARRDGDSYVIDGEKRWIGNGSIADVVVVWARDTSDNAVKGFLVEKGTPGYNATVMTGKASLRAIWQAQISMAGVRLPAENRLPGAHSFKDCGRVLATTRSACAWMALGHAVAGFDAALTYAKRRKQFRKSLSSFQIIQERLVKMLADVTAMQLYCVQIAKLDEVGKLSPTLAGLAKMHNTTKAREILANARDLLGGNGILLDYHVIRHMTDIESIHTFEGTETVQTLIVGRDITGVGAFS